MSMRLLLLGLVIHAAVSCEPPDCDRVDLGSCVGACCKVTWTLPHEASPESAINKVAAFLTSQGADGRYTIQQNHPTIQPYKSKTTFVVQGHHITQNLTYVDSLHFASDTSDKGVKIYAFSHSQDYILGNFAYSDRGQNYKNLAMLIKSLKVNYSETIDHGCGS